MWLNSNQIFLRGFSCPFEITGRTLSTRSAAFRPSFACLSADRIETPTMIATPNVSLDDRSTADNLQRRPRLAPGFCRALISAHGSAKGQREVGVVDGNRHPRRRPFQAVVEPDRVSRSQPCSECANRVRNRISHVWNRPYLQDGAYQGP
jgi:hypothetical protein